MGKQWKQWQTLFWGLQKLLQVVTAAMKLRHLLLGRKTMTNLESIFKSRDITLETKIHIVKAIVFPMVIYGCESCTIKEGWVWKNSCFWTVVLEKTLESPLDCVEIKPVHPKGDQSWIFIGRTDAEAETPIFWPPYGKNWLIGKDPGNDWRQEEKGMTEDEMVECHQQVNGHEFEQALGFADGQGRLACYSPWDCRESDMTEWLNWTQLCGFLHTIYWSACLFFIIYSYLFCLRLIDHKCVGLFLGFLSCPINLCVWFLWQ